MLSPPLQVGHRVMAMHPRLKKVFPGMVLTVHPDRYRIQFDRGERGRQGPLPRSPPPPRYHHASATPLATSALPLPQRTWEPP